MKQRIEISAGFLKLSPFTAALFLMLIISVLSGKLKAQTDTPDIKGALSACHCKAACWLGIEPGVTTTAQAQSILDSLNIQYRLITIDSGTGTIAWDITDETLVPATPGRVDMYFQSNIIYQIRLRTIFDAALLFQQYGQPAVTTRYAIGAYDLFYADERIIFTVYIGSTDRVGEILLVDPLCSVAKIKRKEAAANGGCCRQVP
jgi:hypothetical protein